MWRSGIVLVVTITQVFLLPSSSLARSLSTTYDSAIEIEIKRPRHCNDANEDCKRLIGSGLKVLEASSGWLKNEVIDGGPECQPEVQEVLMPFEKKQCPTYITFDLPNCGNGKSGAFSLALFADPNDVLRTTAVTIQKQDESSPALKALRISASKGAAVVQTPFCTSMILARFKTCKEENYSKTYNPAQYVYSWNARLAVFGVKESVAGPSRTILPPSSTFADEVVSSTEAATVATETAKHSFEYGDAVRTPSNNNYDRNDDDCRGMGRFSAYLMTDLFMFAIIGLGFLILWIFWRKRNTGKPTYANGGQTYGYSKRSKSTELI